VAGFRVLQLLPGVGAASAGRVLDKIEATGDPIQVISEFRPPARAAQDWPGFLALLRQLRSRPPWPAELDNVRLWYEPHLERMHDDAPLRAADLVQLGQIASGYPSRERFLTELTLDPPDATSGEAGVPYLDEDYLILSTIHSAKGQEWTSVFILNAVDGCIPSDMGTGSTEEIEEERRLLYVAMTRAKDHLHLIMPQRFFRRSQAQYGDQHVYAARTRFIPTSILGSFDLCAWPTRTREAPGQRSPEPRPRVDLATRMRGMWR
jgi:DNA helicase-2/ATP-dependent DNA helicase PcrA